MSLEDAGLGETRQTDTRGQTPCEPADTRLATESDALPPRARTTLSRPSSPCGPRSPVPGPRSSAVGSVSPETALGPWWRFTWCPAASLVARPSLPLPDVSGIEDPLYLGGFQTRVTEAGRAPAVCLRARSDPASPAAATGRALLPLGSALPVGLTGSQAVPVQQPRAWHLRARSPPGQEHLLRAWSQQTS